jgi:hypothetical protein
MRHARMLTACLAVNAYHRGSTMLHAANVFIAVNIGAQLAYSGFGYGVAACGALVMLALGLVNIHNARA